MSEIFRVTGSDRRKEYIKAIDEDQPFITQKDHGPEVEYFDPETGFVLLREQTEINPKYTQTVRVRSVAELSLGARLELREFYYTLRQRSELVAAFGDIKNLYGGILSTINCLEIFCDVNREVFTVGNLPRGFVHYGHHRDYGNPEKPIGFTENIAKSVLAEWDVNYAMSIIHLEKMAAATRLVSMGFSKLTNSIITTTGGNFTRAVYALADRFHKKKHMIFFCDGDVFGNDMLRSLEYGTMASRHLTPEQAFPERLNPGIHIAGLFPSIAERLGLPNDLEQKRPMSNPHVQSRMEFLKRHNIVDERDLATWERDQTFELEALSTQYLSTKPDEEGKYPPVGLGIYLIEYKRLKDIPCKPQPTNDDDDLVRIFRERVEEKFRENVESAVGMDSPEYDLKVLIEEKIKEITDRIGDEIIDEYLDKLMEKATAVTADQIREKLLYQYQDDPYREIFSIAEVVEELTDEFDVRVEWEPNELKRKIVDVLEDYVSEREGSIYTEEIEFQDLPEPDEELRPFYDVVEDALGARPEDCEAVREALEWRL